MEIVALFSFFALIVSWLAMPASSGVPAEQAHLPRVAPAKA